MSFGGWAAGKTVASGDTGLEPQTKKTFGSFGAPTNNATAGPSSLFGKTTPAATTGTSTFGNLGASSTTAAATPAPAANLFGGIAAKPAKTGTGSFGSFGTLGGATNTTSPAPASPFGTSANPAAGTSPFGAASTTPATTTASANPFAATVTPASSPFATAAAPATTASPFGAAPATTGFGSLGTTPTIPTSSSPFGASTTTPVAAKSLFGAPVAPTTSTSLFGASTTTPATTTFGAFGAKPATTNAFGSSLAGAPAPALGSSTFGLSTKEANSSLFRSSTVPTVSIPKLGEPLPSNPNEESIMASLESLAKAWDTSNPECKFQTYFYNSVGKDEIAAYREPVQGANVVLWNNAVKNNPDSDALAPVLAVGFPALEQRMSLQEQVSAAHLAKLDEIANHLEGLMQTHQNSHALRIIKARQTVQQLNARLLILIAKNALKNRDGHDRRLTRHEEELQSALRALEGSVRGVGDRVTSLWDGVTEYKIRKREEDSNNSWSITEQGAQQILKILDDQQKGINVLAQKLTAIGADVSIVKGAFGLPPDTL